MPRQYCNTVTNAYVRRDTRPSDSAKLFVLNQILRSILKFEIEKKSLKKTACDWIVKLTSERGREGVRAVETDTA